LLNPAVQFNPAPRPTISASLAMKRGRGRQKRSTRDEEEPEVEESEPEPKKTKNGKEAAMAVEEAPSTPEDLVAPYGTVHRKDGVVSFTFKRNVAMLRNLIQTVCNNRNRNHQPIVPVVTLRDLWFGLPTLKLLLQQDAEKTTNNDDEDEDNQSYLEQSIKAIRDQARNT